MYLVAIRFALPTAWRSSAALLQWSENLLVWLLAPFIMWVSILEPQEQQDAGFDLWYHLDIIPSPHPILACCSAAKGVFAAEVGCCFQYSILICRGNELCFPLSLWWLLRPPACVHRRGTGCFLFTGNITQGETGGLQPNLICMQYPIIDASPKPTVIYCTAYPYKVWMISHGDSNQQFNKAERISQQRPLQPFLPGPSAHNPETCEEKRSWACTKCFHHPVAAAVPIYLGLRGVGFSGWFELSISPEKLF